MSFGGGFGDLTQRAQIMLSMRAEGTGELAAVRAELDKLKSQSQEVHGLWADGKISLRDMLTTLKDYGREISGLTKIERDLASAVNEATAAQKRHAEVIVEAEGEIERIQRKAMGAEVERQMVAEATRKANAKAAMLEANAAQHMSDVLIAGLNSERTAAKLTANELAQLNAAKSTGTQKANTYGLGILNVSHAFQDLQYGIAATLNNIPLIITSFGGGPGLAGVVMAAAVGVQLLRENFGTLSDSLGIAAEESKGAKDEIELLKDQIKALEKTGLTLAVDARQLDAAREKLKELEAARKAYEAGAEGKSIYETEAGKESKKLLEDYGDEFKVAQQKVVERMAIDMAARDPELRKADKGIAKAERILANIDQRSQGIMSEEQRISLAQAQQVEEKRLAAAVNAKAMAVERATDNAKLAVGRLKEGVEAGNQPKARAELAGWMRFAGAKDLAERLEVLTPEGMQEREQTGVQIEEMQEHMKKEKARVQKSIRWDEALQRAQEKADEDHRRITDQDANAVKREREQDVAHHATAMSTQFGQEGELDLEILRRKKAGKGMEDLAPKVRARLKGVVPDDIAGEVASQILQKATERVNAEIASMGGGRNGIAAALDQQFDKLEQAQRDFIQRQQAPARFQKAQEKIQAGEDQGIQEQGLAEAIDRITGGQMSDQGLVTAAHRAMLKMRQGADAQRAIMATLAQMMNQVGNQQDQIMQMMWGMQARIGGVQAQAGRNRARRPGLLPVFPGN